MQFSAALQNKASVRRVQYGGDSRGRRRWGGQEPGTSDRTRVTKYLNRVT